MPKEPEIIKDVYTCVGGFKYVAPRGTPADDLLGRCRGQKQTAKHTYCGLLKGWRKCEIDTIQRWEPEGSDDVIYQPLRIKAC